MKAMYFGCQKSLETGNFWNFSISFLAITFFKETPFLTRFSIQNFSLLLSQHHILPSFSILKKLFFTPTFQLQFFLRMRIFFHLFSNLEFSVLKFPLQFFNFYWVGHLVFPYFSNIIFLTRGGVRLMRMRRSPRVPRFWGLTFIQKNY